MDEVPRPFAGNPTMRYVVYVVALLSGILLFLYWAIFRSNQWEHGSTTGQATAITRTDETCTMHGAFLDFSRALERLAKVKGLCAYISNPQQVVACTSALPFPVHSHVRNCQDLEVLTNDLNVWLTTVIPPAREACQHSQDTSCSTVLSQNWIE